MEGAGQRSRVTRMKAAVYTRYGPPDVLQISKQRRPFRQLTDRGPRLFSERIRQATDKPAGRPPWTCKSVPRYTATDFSEAATVEIES